MALSLPQAVELVAQGGVIVYPTETLWGVGGRALDRAVYARVLCAKGIAAPRPVPVLAADADVAGEFVLPVPGLPALVERFWPGGLTLVLPPANRHLEHLLGPDGGLALRVSAHPVAQALAAAAGGLLLSTSANLTGQRPPQRLEEVASEFLSATDGAVEWGEAATGLPSTLLVFRDGWRVGRVGSVPVVAVRNALAEAGETLFEEGP